MQLPSTWAARIPATSATALGAIRLVSGLEALKLDDAIWVRGPKLEAQDEEEVRRVPWEERYEILDDGHLRSAGRLLPDLRLPEGEWLSLASFLRVHPLQRLMGGHSPPKVSLELRPGGTPEDPSLLHACTADWGAWVERAPLVRLERLVFAVDATRPEWVFIRGTPLPPLMGARFVVTGDIATPAGSRWWPEVAPATLRRALDAAQTELVIFWADASYSRIPRSAWITATRASVRLTFSPDAHAE